MTRPRGSRLARVGLALGLLGSLVLATPGGVGAYPACDPGWRYTNVTRYANRMRYLSGPFAFQNDTPNKQSFTLTKSVTGTVGFTTSIGGGVAVDVIIAKVEAKTGLELHRSVSVSTTLSATVTVDPHRTGHLGFGVWRVVTRGHYYYVGQTCHITDKGYITALTPLRKGFRAWQTRY